MIEKIDRKTVFEKHNNIAAEISGIQRAFYDEDDLNSYDTNEEKEEYLSSFDALDFTIDSKPSINKIISLDFSDIDNYTAILAQNLSNLLSEIKVEKLIIITNYKMNFFGNLKIKHKHLRAAYNNLYEIIGNKNYSEAFKIELEDLFNFINMFFWMERIDGSAPEYIFFYDEKDRISFYLCKFGKVHTIEYDFEILTPEILNKNNFETIDECSDGFSKGSWIKDRLFKI